ncbi:hypothetical protein [Streptomyces sp. NBC_01423]|uniref:hypothetical protein n=1 Tax=Streptomyces sp. NBC_01423 TaxID=2903860 RepID=UPI002E2E13F6|nr:hypothetical protein [Streptomyces sp. NBC_01423]
MVLYRPCISPRVVGNAGVKAAVVSDHLRTRLVDPVLPVRDDSDAFFAAPHEALARAIESATGKAVVIGEGYPDNGISHEDVGKDEGDDGLPRSRAVGGSLLAEVQCRVGTVRKRDIRRGA